MEVANSYNDVEPIEQTAPDGRIINAYPAKYLIFLTRIGIKIAPTFADGLGFNTKDLFTDEEYSKFPECENHEKGCLIDTVVALDQLSRSDGGY